MLMTELSNGEIVLGKLAAPPGTGGGTGRVHRTIIVHHDASGRRRPECAFRRVHGDDRRERFGL